eukprot:Pgem_evm1s13734
MYSALVSSLLIASASAYTCNRSNINGVVSCSGDCCGSSSSGSSSSSSSGSSSIATPPTPPTPPPPTPPTPPAPTCPSSVLQFTTCQTSDIFTVCGSPGVKSCHNDAYKITLECNNGCSYERDAYGSKKSGSCCPDGESFTAPSLPNPSSCSNTDDLTDICVGDHSSCSADAYEITLMCNDGTQYFKDAYDVRYTFSTPSTRGRSNSGSNARGSNSDSVLNAATISFTLLAG